MTIRVIPVSPLGHSADCRVKLFGEKPRYCVDCGAVVRTAKRCLPCYRSMPDRAGDLATRLWRKVDADGDCWLWTGSTGGGGYGHIQVRIGVFARTHRVAWELLVGPVPEGMVLDHLCNVPQCVNPAHLEVVTQRENTRRIPNRTTRAAWRTALPDGSLASGRRSRRVA